MATRSISRTWSTSCSDRCLAGRGMFTRDEILSRVWRYDYFGGLRTVDVNVRLVRALGQDHAR